MSCPKFIPKLLLFGDSHFSDKLLAIVIFGIRGIMGGKGAGPAEEPLATNSRAEAAGAVPEAPIAEAETTTNDPVAKVEENPELEGLIDITRIVTEVEEVIVEVTAVPEEPEPASFTAPDSTTLLEMTSGDIDTLDPSLAYDTFSQGILQNTMEGLVTFNGRDSTNFVPALSLEVPDLENGLISRDGLTYTFNIRDGVTFHEGGELTPSDVAYTFQRGLLQSDPNGPQLLLLEPIMGYASGDITEEINGGAYYGDREGLIAGASPAELVEVCETVKERISANDAVGTVTFKLAQPWAPFLATISSLGFILDKEWVIEQGGWDGDCTTWQNWYAPGSENSELTAIVNGTGPYKLDRWTPGEEWVLSANKAYWRTRDDPVWEDGPAGQPQIETIIRTVADEWDIRFSALQDGEAGSVNVTAADWPLVDPLVGEFCDWETGACVINEKNPDGPLRKWDDLPGVSRSNLFPSFNTGADSPYIGSGLFDGEGIPPDFFSDNHVRRAIGYCMDFDRLKDEVYNGEGVQNNGPIIRGMLGYNDNGPMYKFDLDQCAAELELAWNGQLPETGFRFSILFNTGNVVRQTAAQILQENLTAINSNYVVEVVGVPWPTFLTASRTGQIPLVLSGWFEDIHDPHNWVVPFTYGTYGGRQQLPDDLKAQFQELATAGIETTDPAKREAIYFELQRLFYDEAVSIPLIQAAGTRYEQRYLDGYTFRSGQSIENPYYYGMSLEGGE